MEIKGNPLLFYAPINYSGYGQASTQLLNELDFQGCEVALQIISEKNCEPCYDELVKRCKKRMENYNPKFPSLKVFHENQICERIGNGLYFAMFFHELNSYADKVKKQLHTADYLIVSSDWAKDILRSEGFNNVGVVPLGVDRSIFNEFVEPMFPENGNTVYSVTGKFELRKGYDVILECFNKAFEQKDKVQLLLKSHHPLRDKKKMMELNDSWKTAFKTSKLGNKIHIFEKFDSQQELASFMMSCDVGLTISRAEAWNLENLEYLSLGKNVITTFNTGHTQYITENNARCIKLTAMEDAYDQYYFFGEVNNQGKWHTFTNEDKDLFIHYLREIHKMKQEGSLTVNKAGIETAKQFSWTNSVNKLSEIIWN